MAKNQNENSSISAFRVFETLKCLIKNPADVDEIIEYLEALPGNEGKAYSKAVVYKYLSTLKFAGIDISRNKCRYKVNNLPFKINLDKDCLYAIETLKQILDFTPENDLVKELQTFLYNINMRCNTDNTNRELIAETISKQFENQKANDLQIKILREYEKYCRDKLKLQIEYYNVFNENLTVTCEPIEAKFEDGAVLLNTYCEHPNQFLELNSNQIIKIKQLPTASSNRENYLTFSTVFTLKGRLAKRYTPRPLEIRMDSGLNDTTKTFSNKDESKEDLYLRLMRYSESCYINSPKSDREIMKNLIAKTLKNYGVEV